MRATFPVLLSFCVVLACSSKKADPPTSGGEDPGGAATAPAAEPAAEPAASFSLTAEQQERIWRREDAVLDQEKNALLFVDYSPPEDTEVLSISPAAPAESDDRDGETIELEREQLAEVLGAHATRPMVLTGIPTQLEEDPESGAVKGPDSVELPAIAGSLSFEENRLRLTAGGKTLTEELDGGGVTTPVPQTVFISPDGKTVWVLVAYKGDSFTSYGATPFRL